MTSSGWSQAPPWQRAIAYAVTGFGFGLGSHAVGTSGVYLLRAVQDPDSAAPLGYDAVRLTLGAAIALTAIYVLVTGPRTLRRFTAWLDTTVLGQSIAGLLMLATTAATVHTIYSAEFAWPLWLIAVPGLSIWAAGGVQRFRAAWALWKRQQIVPTHSGDA